MPINGYSSYHQQFGSAVPMQEQLMRGAAIVTKPIEKVENIVNETVDTFTPIETTSEETKKRHKTAIKVASTVIVLSTLIPFLNPKFSSKLINKIKTASLKYGSKGKNSNSLMSQIYKGAELVSSKTAKLLNFSNNYNTVKDELFKWLCNKSKILQKPHEIITRSFDKISRQTVFSKYKKAEASFDTLDNAIKNYKQRLSKIDAAKIDSLMEKAAKQKEYLAPQNIENRLKEQENLMSDLESVSIQKIKEYGLGFTSGDRIKHIKDNMYFWAEDLIMPKRNQIETNGLNTIQSIIGETKAQKGTYNEIFDIIAPNIKNDEKAALEEILKNTEKKLKTANKTECIEYFDKKRDLILGSAPTDVLSAIIGLAASGIAIGSADTKEDKTSRAITVAFPAIAGLGVSMGMTAMLYSGIKGMLIGAASSVVLSLTGSSLDKAFIKSKKVTKQQ